MVEVGTRIVCVEIFEHCVCGFPGEALGSNKVCGNGSTMGAHIPSHGPRPVAETMIVFISALLLDTCIVTAATELTAPSWPSRIAHIFHYVKHKHTDR